MQNSVILLRRTSCMCLRYVPHDFFHSLISFLSVLGFGSAECVSFGKYYLGRAWKESRVFQSVLQSSSCQLWTNHVLLGKKLPGVFHLVLQSCSFYFGYKDFRCCRSGVPFFPCLLHYQVLGAAFL